MTTTHVRPLNLFSFCLIATFGGCQPRQTPTSDNHCDPAAPQCPAGQSCELFADGLTQCALSVTIVGHVVAFADQSSIPGALVQAIDVNGAAVGDTAITDSDGGFHIVVPAKRDANGVPTEGAYTLRVQAAGFQEFPTALRPALPLDVSAAIQSDSGWAIENSLTTVGLIALPGDTTALGSISGTVSSNAATSILVVAQGAMSYVGFSDASGTYTIFNIPAGNYTVKGYAADVQIASAAITVAPGQAVTGLDLTETGAPLSTVSGNVQIVNAPGGSTTSVILAVESTFDDVTARGQAPPGLRVGDVSGAFAIANVPDGRYVVLAAFENDNLVRDPDENIAGTQIVHIEVPDPATGNSITLSQGFKITGALAVVSPGADGPEQVNSPTPTFVWGDDSSEDGYTIRVFDAFGAKIWETEIGSITGSATVNVDYAGPPLVAGMFYQFRVTSFRERSGSRSSISTTEDLKGVFYFLGS